MKFPHKQIYLLYGNEEERLNETRRELVEHFLSREEREENFVEFSPSSQRKRTTLSAIMPDLLAELGTISFFPGSRRVAVVYNLDELYSRKKKPSAIAKKRKKSTKGAITPEAYFIKYLEDQFPQTNNILILVNVEAPEDYVRVDEKSNLVKALKKMGHFEKYTSRPLQWDFEDALRQRQFSQATRIFRHWMARDSESARRIIFHITLKQIILMLQAKVRSKKKSLLALDEDLLRILFPQEMKYNLGKERDFVQKKIMQGEKRYTTNELINALRKLVQVNIFLYPQTTDVFVPDFQMIFERFLVELMASKKTHGILK